MKRIVSSQNSNFPEFRGGEYSSALVRDMPTLGTPAIMFCFHLLSLMIDAQARRYRLGESFPRREEANRRVAERGAVEPDGEARILAYHERNGAVAGHAIGQKRIAAGGCESSRFRRRTRARCVGQRNRRGACIDLISGLVTVEFEIDSTIGRSGSIAQHFMSLTCEGVEKLPRSDFPSCCRVSNLRTRITTEI